MATDSQVSRRDFLGSALALTVGGAGPLRRTLHADAAPPPPPIPRTLREKVGQLFVISFKGLSADPSFLTFLRQNSIGGVTLFARNCGSPAQITTLTAQLQRASRFPLIVSVDQEGGDVARIRNGVHVFPSESYYGTVGSSARVRADAATTAHDLRALGITMNLAPVADILANPQSFIGSRSFGADPILAARLTGAAVQGYQQHGLAAVAKHFVGLGHTTVNSDNALPTVNRSLAQLERADFIPFRAAIAAGVSTVLVAHVVLPAIDPTLRPASLSPVVIGSLLRGRLGFKGVVMTDSLTAGALAGGHRSEAAEEAFAAGADLLLLATDHDFSYAIVENAIARIVAAIKAGRIPQSRLDASIARIAALKRRF
jgi:beta-N-acetylhexosaminidase